MKTNYENQRRILVTGGAGFIGSNIVKALLKDPRVSFVRILDNLSTGKYENIKNYLDDPKIEFVEGDIRDFEVCHSACEGISLISHQAALGSVPRSIIDPLATNEVNISGTLNIFKAAVDNKIDRVVFAASSSTYGDNKTLPKREKIIGKPLSPYAITKYVNELYAEIFSRIYEFEFIGLRYFNIFGPNQDPNGAYAAVIPLFMKAAINNYAPAINGDGSFSRDFTFVKNAVDVNLKALFIDGNQSSVNQVYNVACGTQTSLNELWNLICKISGCKLRPIYGPERKGDVPHSLADISKALKLLDYLPLTSVHDGLAISYKWYKDNKVL